MKRILLSFVGIGLAGAAAQGQSPYQSSEDFARYAMKLRENALLQIEPKVLVPTTSRNGGIGAGYPWKTDIVTTIFWVGESATLRNPVHNRSSSWDADWADSYGGFDDPNPASRSGFLPSFVPKQNPFYCALPYNDVTRGSSKPEARTVIPWFRQAFKGEGKSVCRDRWIAIRKGNKTCYAQWSDCGPFRTDHYQYVFGNEKPKPNLNRGAGLDVSPAVRDYLRLAPTDTTDWKFVEFKEIPNGPWAHWGENNTFVQLKRAGATQVASSAIPPLSSRSAETPKVLTK
jgi:hypothetical protein